MSIKLKALGLGLFAMMAMGALGVMNASANGEGDFDVEGASSLNPVTITGIEENLKDPEEFHNLEFEADTGGIIECTETSYHGVVTDETPKFVDVTPKFEKCDTTPIEEPHGVVVDVQGGCVLRFTVGLTATGDNTVDVCPTGGKITITHPNCDIEIKPQTIGDSAGEGGVAYTTIVTDGVHAITLDSTARLTTTYEGGICVFLGTNHTAEMFGSATVVGEDDEGNPVGITATGKND